MNKLLMVGLAACVSCYAQSATFAQEQTKFKKENFSYNEWTKGKFSEVVTVTNQARSSSWRELVLSGKVMER